VILATLATIIASQAVISGAFSVTQQAVQLGFLPRLRILHTSAKAAGQIYIPLVNWGLLVMVVHKWHVHEAGVKPAETRLDPHLESLRARARKETEI